VNQRRCGETVRSCIHCW